MVVLFGHYKKGSKLFRHIIDAIDPLTLSTIDTDVKGEAFEYFLEKTTSTENDLGEYFTPRNIVKTIINLVDPKFKETIYDPFCGTGGFLTEAFNYIKENNIIKRKEDLKKLKNNTFYGREITTTSRVAKMNMILHGDGHSGIQQINTLLNADYIEKIKKFNPKTQKEEEIEKIKKFDVIITNIPFSQSITRKITENGKIKIENNISPLYYNGIAKNSGDAACILHCLRALKKGGRMALLAPEGFLFRKDTANVRKFLLSKAKLQTVISLPKGTFLPYTGVKTDILYFIDVHKNNNQKSYWYFEANNIGITLNNHKRKIKGDNDLKKIESSDIKKVDKKTDLQDNMLEIGFEIIDMEKVKNNDYNLIGSYYREIDKSSRYNMVSLLDILLTLETGSRPKGGVSGINKGAISLGGEQIGNDGKLDLSKIPFVSMKFYQKAKRGFVKDKDILVCKDGALTGKVCMVDFDLLPQKEVMTNEHAYILRGNSNLIKQSFLFYCLNSPKVQLQIKNLAYNKSAQPGLNRDHIKKIQIPLPSIEEQKKIVNELDIYQNIIDGSKQVIKKWKPIFQIKNHWKRYFLSDLCDIVRGGSPRPIRKYITPNKNGYNWLKIGDVSQKSKYIEHTKEKIKEDGLKHTRFIMKDNFVVSNSMSFGRPYVLKIDVCIHDGWLALKNIKKHINKDYLYYFFLSDYCKNYLRKCAIGSTVKNLNISIVSKISVPLPSLEEQNKIVDELEKERQMIEAQKETVKLFEKKFKNKLSNFWKDINEIKN